MSDPLITLRQFAELCQVSYGTFAGYHKDAQRRRVERRPRPGDVPEPSDHTTDAVPRPRWHLSVALAYAEARRAKYQPQRPLGEVGPHRFVAGLRRDRCRDCGLHSRNRLHTTTNQTAGKAATP